MSNELAGGENVFEMTLDPVQSLITGVLLSTVMVGI
jgi:hypothetical protein